MSQTKKQQKPSAAKAMTQLQAKLLFAKIVKDSKTMDEAWRRVRKMFPRKTYGKVRDIARAFSEHKTFTKAYAAAHGKKSAKMSLKRAA
jgi:hypothetical protein